MFSGHPQALIILNPWTMTIQKWLVTTLLIVWIGILYTNFEEKSETRIFNFNFELKLWIWMLNLSFERELWTQISELNYE